MARRKKGELPSGNIRRQVFVGYEYIFDDKGHPILDEKGNQKKKRKYESITASSVQEANLLAAQYKMSKEQPKKPEMRFLDARNNYIELKRNVLSPSTIRGYVQMRTYFHALDNRKLCDITSEVVQSWVNQFASSHSPKTTKNAYGFIVSVLAQYDISVKATLPSREIKDLYVPSDDDIKRLIQYFKDEKNDTDMLIAVYLASFGTMRRSEICGLDADDVSGTVIHIHNAVVVNDAKETVARGKTKTTSSDRYVDVPQFVADMLPKSGPLVNISPDNITHRFRRALLKCNITPFRFHDLRHYSASIMHAIGVPDVYIMDRGGWHSDETLKRIYRGTIEDYKKQFVTQTNAHFENLQHNLQHKV